MAQSARTPAFDAVYDTDQGNNTTIARRVADKVARMEAVTERARFKKVRVYGGGLRWCRRCLLMNGKLHASEPLPAHTV